MKTLTAALMLTASVALAAGAAKPAAAPAVPAAPAFTLGGDAAKGEGTFKAMCAACHGEKGKGDGPASATLNPKPADFTDPVRAAAASDEYVYKMVTNGGAANGKSPLMIAWGPALGDETVRNVSAYVRGLQKAAVQAAAPAVAPAKDAKAAAKDAKKPAK